jgi:aminomethyltransferase
MAHRTPLYDWHLAHKARMVEFGGWDMPIQYTNITDEHNAVRNGVGLFDISHMGRLAFQGREAEDFLQYLFTNDTASMKPRQVRYGLVCNDTGGILDDVLVYRLEAFWLMVVNASNREKIVKWVEEHRGTFDVQVVDETMAWGMVAIQGPDAHKLVKEVAPPALDLKYYYSTTAMTEPGRLRIWSRTGYTGEDGWEVIVPAGELVELVDHLSKKVAKQVGVKLVPCGLGARDTLRLEAGMPLYGHELSEKIDPFQAGLGWAVKLNKGQLIGKPSLEQHQDISKRRQRVGLEIQGKRIAREGATVSANGKTVGEVTSGTFSPTLEKAIAMAYVDPALIDVGTRCEVDIRGKPAPAQVVALPFYQREK